MDMVSLPPSKSVLTRPTIPIILSLKSSNISVGIVAVNINLRDHFDWLRILIVLVNVLETAYAAPNFK